MSSSTAIAPRRRPNPGCLTLLSATAILASTSAASAGQDAGPVVRNGASELRFAGAYQAGKVPVVFIHGLLGVPGQWSVMLDRLSGEPAIRARYQFLTFRYDSLRSIAESGSLLAQALDEASRRFDPEGRDHCFDRVVVVGHSMGGLVAKAALGALERRCPGPLRTWADRGGPTRASRVGRYVFIATPHRGAPINRGAIRSVGSWLARKLSPPSAADGTQQSSVDQLAWEHPLLAELERARASAGAPFHSIIAALWDPLADGATDGVVPIASSRLAGAQSEVVVQTHHLCLDQPKVIQAVREVLIEHIAPRAGAAPDAASHAGTASSVPVRITENPLLRNLHRVAYARCQC